MERRCPENIVRMFDSESTIDEGRLKAIEWLKGEVQLMKAGETVLIPDPITGELMSFTKTEYKQ